jgi:hypothetical protein
VKAEKLKSKQNLIIKIMKKVLMITAVIFSIAVSITEAQINKGRWLTGVSTSFSYVNFGSDIMSLGYTTVKTTGNSSGDPVKYTTLNFLPKAGYFVADNLVIGLNSCLATSVEKSDQSKYKTTYFGIGPFARYYIKGNKVMPFFEVSTLFGSMTDKSDSQGYSYSDKTSVTSLGAGAGIAVKLADKVTFDIMAGYNSLTAKAKQDNPDDTKTVQGTIGLKLGFVVLLGSN